MYCCLAQIYMVVYKYKGVMSMKKLFDAADVYLRQSTWKDLDLVKFCLFSMGLFCGLFVKEKNKKH